MNRYVLTKVSITLWSLCQVGPRFAENGSFEFEYGEKWKQLYEMKKQKLEALEREMKIEEDKLIAQMEFARYEHETEKLKQQLQKNHMLHPAVVNEKQKKQDGPWTATSKLATVGKKKACHPQVMKL